jgi:hypothetical protein
MATRSLHQRLAASGGVHLGEHSTTTRPVGEFLWLATISSLLSYRTVLTGKVGAAPSRLIRLGGWIPSAFREETNLATNLQLLFKSTPMKEWHISLAVMTKKRIQVNLDVVLHFANQTVWIVRVFVYLQVFTVIFLGWMR